VLEYVWQWLGLCRTNGLSLLLLLARQHGKENLSFVRTARKISGDWDVNQDLLTVSLDCGAMTALPWTCSTLALALSYSFFFSSSAESHER
jgi:hypothetical protein